MITWNWSDTDCKSEWPIFTRLISLTGPLSEPSGCVSFSFVLWSETQDGSRIVIWKVWLAQFHDWIDRENLTWFEHLHFHLESTGRYGKESAILNLWALVGNEQWPLANPHRIFSLTAWRFLNAFSDDGLVHGNAAPGGTYMITRSLKHFGWTRKTANSFRNQFFDSTTSIWNILNQRQ